MKHTDMLGSRRTSILNVVVAVVAIILLLYGYVLYSQVSDDLQDALDGQAKCDEMTTSLRGQLKTIYNHVNKVQASLKNEREEHKASKSSFKKEIKICNYNLTRSKHQATNRFNALNTEFQLLKSRYDEMKSQYEMVQVKYARLASDNKRMAKQWDSNYRMLKKDKDSESKVLQERVQELFKQNEQSRGAKIEIEKEMMNSAALLAKASKDVLKHQTLEKTYKQRIKDLKESLQNSMYNTTLCKHELSTLRMIAASRLKQSKKADKKHLGSEVVAPTQHPSANPIELKKNVLPSSAELDKLDESITSLSRDKKEVPDMKEEGQKETVLDKLENKIHKTLLSATQAPTQEVLAPSKEVEKESQEKDLMKDSISTKHLPPGFVDKNNADPIKDAAAISQELKEKSEEPLAKALPNLQAKQVGHLHQLIPSVNKQAKPAFNQVQAPIVAGAMLESQQFVNQVKPPQASNVLLNQPAAVGNQQMQPPKPIASQLRNKPELNQVQAPNAGDLSILGRNADTLNAPSTTVSKDVWNPYAAVPTAAIPKVHQEEGVKISEGVTGAPSTTAESIDNFAAALNVHQNEVHDDKVDEIGELNEVFGADSKDSDNELKDDKTNDEVDTDNAIQNDKIDIEDGAVLEVEPHNDNIIDDNRDVSENQQVDINELDDKVSQDEDEIGDQNLDVEKKSLADDLKKE